MAAPSIASRMSLSIPQWDIHCMRASMLFGGLDLILKVVNHADANEAAIVNKLKVGKGDK